MPRLVVLSLLFLLLVGAAAPGWAQVDATPEAPSVITMEETPVVIPAGTDVILIPTAPDTSGDPSWTTIALIGIPLATVIGGLLTGVPLALALRSLSKAQKDSLEKAFESASPATQDKIHEGIVVVSRVADALADVLKTIQEGLKVAKEVTDGLPNSPPAVTPPG